MLTIAKPDFAPVLNTSEINVWQENTGDRELVYQNVVSSRSFGFLATARSWNKSDRQSGMVGMPSPGPNFLQQINEGIPMKNILLVSILIFGSSIGLAQTEQKTVALIDSNLKLEELESLPEGLSVSHTPDPVFYTSFIPSLSGVQWKHSTTVSSLVGPVTILEFGYFVARKGRWEFPYGVEVPYTYNSSDFAKKYDCPGSELQLGESYTDTKNRSVIDCVPEQLVKWYFIGLDAKGNRVKGEASVKLVTELAE